MSTDYTDGGAKVLPFYIVCDESGSMGPYIDTVNASLRELHQVLATDPVVSDKAMISIITFNDTAQVLLELERPDMLTSMPGCTSRGGTSYSAAFSQLKQAIDQDVTKLRQRGLSVLRPVAFFMSDGAPTDPVDWEEVHRQVVDPANKRRPHILSFGVADADARVIFNVATPIDRLGSNHRYAWMQEQDGDPGTVLKEIIRNLAKTVISSVHSVESNDPTLIPPENIPGARLIRLDEID